MKAYFPIYGAFHTRYTGLGYTLRYVTPPPPPPRFTSKLELLPSFRRSELLSEFNRALSVITNHTLPYKYSPHKK